MIGIALSTIGLGDVAQAVGKNAIGIQIADVNVCQEYPIITR